jgi:hypothetical protein
MGVAAKAVPANKAKSMARKIVLRVTADGIEVIRIHSRGRGRRLAQIRIPIGLVLWEIGGARFAYPTLAKNAKDGAPGGWWRGWSPRTRSW